MKQPTAEQLRRLGIDADLIPVVLGMPAREREELLAVYREHRDTRGGCGLVVNGQQPLPGSHRYPWLKGRRR